MFQEHQKSIQQIGIEVWLLGRHNDHCLVDIDDRRPNQAVLSLMNLENIALGLVLSRKIHKIPHIGGLAFFPKIPACPRLVNLAVGLYVIETRQGFDNDTLQRNSFF